MITDEPIEENADDIVEPGVLWEVYFSEAYEQDKSGGFWSTKRKARIVADMMNREQGIASIYEMPDPVPFDRWAIVRVTCDEYEPIAGHHFYIASFQHNGTLNFIQIEDYSYMNVAYEKVNLFIEAYDGDYRVMVYAATLEDAEKRVAELAANPVIVPFKRP